MRIVAGSGNPSKIQAVRQAFEKLFPTTSIEVRSHPVPSGVSDQPFGDEETLQGAINRAQACHVESADFFVGLEGGCEWKGDTLEAFAWMVVSNGDKYGKARTASFDLPPSVAELVGAGMELGHADDQVFGRKNSKHGNGAVGILTGGLIDRATYYEPAIILAAIPFINDKHY